ncbi:hypothetical protein M0R45_019285 [Rubus argutus]|uniref:Uncharacterized protein n=1 Tax=Rubus argutus TaxID=59490 RepID=A0AAW1X6V9_RUBAR
MILNTQNQINSQKPKQDPHRSLYTQSGSCLAAVESGLPWRCRRFLEPRRPLQSPPIPMPPSSRRSLASLSALAPLSSSALTRRSSIPCSSRRLSAMPRLQCYTVASTPPSP